MTNQFSASFRPAPEAHQERIKRLVCSRNMSMAAKLLGCSELTVSKVAGGQFVSQGTRALMAIRIAARDAEGKDP